MDFETARQQLSQWANNAQDLVYRFIEAYQIDPASEKTQLLRTQIEDAGGKVTGEGDTLRVDLPL